jgi:hypothetical protein
MNMISKILIGIGLLTTVAGNLATRYGLNFFLKAMEESAEKGIARVAEGVDMAFTYNTVSLIGCFVLVVGLVLAALSRRQPS